MKHIDVKLSKFQKEFIDRRDEDLLVLATGISAGKSKVAGLWCVLETIQERKRIICAAQNFKSLAEVLFREIKYWLQKFGIEYHEKYGQKIELTNGSEIFGASAENPEGILGFTDISAAIIDEAAYCPEELYHYIGDRMRGNGIKPKYRLISSPSNQTRAKWFADLCMKNPDKVIHATALDNPFTSDEFKESLKERYGVGSPLYCQQVLGQFIDTDSSDCLLKPEDFIACNNGSDTEYVIGCDLARFGVDRTVIILRDSYKIIDIIILHHADTFRITHEIHELYRKYKIKATYLDGTGGFSGGTYDMLKLRYDNVREINFGAKSPDDTCANNRSYMYRNLAKAIKDGFCLGEKNRELREELLAQRIKLNPRGLFQLIPKEDIKDYLGRSPDLSDALALSFYTDKEQTYTVEQNQNIAMRFYSI